MRKANRKSRKGFSLIELVIVVVIIGIIAAIAIPKMSRGATGASEAALQADLQVLRNALEMYQAEHNGQYPDDTNVTAQLIGTTDSEGIITAPGTPGIVLYGPYLKNVPRLPVGNSSQRGNSGIASSPGAGTGWIYDSAAGGINANAIGADAAGNSYSNY